MKENWTIARVLHWTSEHFAQKGLLTPRLDAELIIAHALGADRVYLYTHGDKPLVARERENIKSLIKRRLSGEPVAYITGIKEFWGMPFEVTPQVLVPRPETEEIIELARQVFGDRGNERLLFLDLGTGSGCIAAALVREFPNSAAVATELSEKALEVARRNFEKLGMSKRIKTRRGDMFGALRPGDGPFDAIASNPPYVPTDQIRDLAPEVRAETRMALDGGADGLDYVRHIVENAPRHLKPGGWLFIEIGARQAEEAASLVTSALSFEGFRKDLAGIDRVAMWARRAGL